MATTTNFGWETPDDTDLVKDGAAAMRTLGNSIDTSFVDLKGGTTGQVLAKASATDLDYTWTTPQVGDITAVTAGTGISGGGTGGDVTVTNSMATAIDAKGDLIAGTGADAFSRLAVGTNGQVLTADSTAATGLAWASASSSFVGCRLKKSGGANQSISNSTSTIITWDAEDYDTNSFHDNATNNTRVTIPSGKGGKYLFSVTGWWASNTTGSRHMYLQVNGSTIPAYHIESAEGNVAIGLSQVFALSAADYVEFGVFQDSGGALNVEGGYLFLTATYLGA